MTAREPLEFQSTVTSVPKHEAVNGVPVQRLVETIREIRREPQIAKFTFRTRNGWENGAHNRAATAGYHGALQDFHRRRPHLIDLDEPEVLLGEDLGANPVEVLLAALSGCLTTSLVYHAAAMGIELDEVTSTYEGHLDLHGFLGLDDSVRNGYERIRVEFHLESASASEEQLDELVRIAQERSPVFDVVTRGTAVEVTRRK